MNDELYEKIAAMPSGEEFQECRLTTDEVKLLARRSKALDVAKTALEHYADECDTCGYDAEMHETHIGNPSVCDEFQNIAVEALATIAEITGGTKDVD